MGDLTADKNAIFKYLLHINLNGIRDEKMLVRYAYSEFDISLDEARKITKEWIHKKK